MPHNDTTNLDGLELGKRIERTGASDVNLDAEQLCGARRGRKFERDRPPRIATDRAKHRLQRKIVDLDDRTIDVVVKALAVAQDRMARLPDRLDPNHPLDAGVDRKATFTEPGQCLGLRFKRDSLQRTDRITPERQWPLGRDRRVELPQRPSRRVARIHVHRQASVEAFFVESPEGLERDIALAAHLDQRGRIGIVDRERDCPNRADVRRHVLARLAVATRHRPLEQAVAVHQRQRQTIDLWLHDEGRLLCLTRLAQQLLQADIPGDQLVVVARIGKRQHRQQMAHLTKAARDPARDALRRRIGLDQFWLRGLECT